MKGGELECVCARAHADRGRLHLIHGVVKTLLADNSSDIAEAQSQKQHSQKAETAVV